MTNRADGWTCSAKELPPVAGNARLMIGIIGDVWKISDPFASSLSELCGR